MNLPYRVVLDTNIIVAAGTKWLVDATYNNNRCRHILVAVAEKHVGAYCSDIILEYIEKLKAFKHSDSNIVLFMTYILGSFQSVSINSGPVAYPPPDPDDEIFIVCAIDGSADYLITDDRHLLSVAQYYEKPVISASQAGEAVLCK